MLISLLIAGAVAWPVGALLGEAAGGVAAVVVFFVALYHFTCRNCGKRLKFLHATCHHCGRDWATDRVAPSPAVAAGAAVDAMRRCPACAEEIQAAAARCRYCGHRFV